MAKVPTEYLYMPSPLFETTKGDFLTDSDALVAIMEAYEKGGVKLPIFFDHPDDDERNGEPAAGFFSLDVRDDGVWAVDVAWSEAAAMQIAQGGWMYHSPEFIYDKKSNRVLEALADALVHEPATRNQRPITAKRKMADNTAMCRAGSVAMDSTSDVDPSADATDTTQPADTKDNDMADAEHEAAIATMKADVEKKDGEIAALSKKVAEAEEAVKASDALVAAVMEAVGVENRDAIVGACKAHRDSAGKLADLTAEVEAFRSEKEEMERTALIEKSGAAHDTIEWLKAQPLPTVRSYVETCCKVPQVSTTPQSTDAVGDDDPGTPEPWFVELHRTKSDEKIAEEWKAHREHASKLKPKFIASTDGAEG